MRFMLQVKILNIYNPENDIKNSQTNRIFLIKMNLKIKNHYKKKYLKNKCVLLLIYVFILKLQKEKNENKNKPV